MKTLGIIVKASVVLSVSFVVACGGDKSSSDLPFYPEPCINILDASISDADRKLLYFYGKGLEEFEGLSVNVVTFAHVNGVENLALARVPIEGGEFSVELERGVTHYSGLGMYIDINRNSVCDDEDRMWEFTTGTTLDGVDLEFSLWENFLQYPDTHCVINGLQNFDVQAVCD